MDMNAEFVNEYIQKLTGALNDSNNRNILLDTQLTITIKKLKDMTEIVDGVMSDSEVVQENTKLKEICIEKDKTIELLRYNLNKYHQLVVESD